MYMAVTGLELDTLCGWGKVRLPVLLTTRQWGGPIATVLLTWYGHNSPLPYGACPYYPLLCNGEDPLLLYYLLGMFQ